MNYMLDLILVAVVVIFAVVGWRRGFFKSVSGLLGIVVAVALVSAFSTPVGKMVDEQMVRPWAVEQVISATGEDFTADTPLSSLDIVSLNNTLSEKFGIDVLGSEIASMSTVGEYAEHLVEKSGITVTISNAIAVIGIFLVASVLMWLLSLLIVPLMKKSLKFFDGTLGIVMGLITAAIVLFVISTAVGIYGSTPQGAAFSPEEVDKTLLFKYVHNINPIKDWFTI